MQGRINTIATGLRFLHFQGDVTNLWPSAGRGAAAGVRDDIIRNIMAGWPVPFMSERLSGRNIEAHHDAQTARPMYVICAQFGISSETMIL